MVPRLVPEISSLDAFCDGGAAAGIGDSRSWILLSLKSSFCSVDDCLEENIYPSHGIAVVVASVEALESKDLTKK